MRVNEPAWSSVTRRLACQVPVPPPETTSPPTASWASARMAIASTTRSCLVVTGSIIRWPS